MTPLTTKAAEIRAGLVKPLEWDLSGMDRGYPAKAESIFGTYSAWEIDDSYWKAPEAHCGRRAGVGLQSALDAAQSDYESRILSALDLSGIEQQAAELAEAREEASAAEERREAHAACATALIDKAEAEMAAIAAAMPGVRFMDPPDGGDVPLSEQVRRMREALTTAEAERDSWRRVCERLETEKQAALAERDELLREKERLGVEYHRRGVSIVGMSEYAGAHLCRAEKAEKERDDLIREKAGLATALASEREACAQIAAAAVDNDSRADCPFDGGAGGMGYRKACYDIEEAIRARSALAPIGEG